MFQKLCLPEKTSEKCEIMEQADRNVFEIVALQRCSQSTIAELLRNQF